MSTNPPSYDPRAFGARLCANAACHASFTPQMHNQTYCSAACRTVVARDRAAKWAEAHPERMADYRKRARLKPFALAPEEYDAMFAAQGGKCAACRQPETVVNESTGAPAALAVDHDHATGKIRKLLCRRCNRILGSVEDAPGLLRALADYLDAHAVESAA